MGLLSVILTLESLFLVSFLAATILPLGSEVHLVAMALDREFPLWLLWLVATVGNTLGSFTTYGLGRLGKLSWLGEKQETVERHREKINRFGHWLGFWGWVPVIGDPMILSMGFLRTSWPLSFGMIGLGKAFRYGLILFWID